MSSDFVLWRCDRICIHLKYTSKLNEILTSGCQNGHQMKACYHKTFLEGGRVSRPPFVGLKTSSHNLIVWQEPHDKWLSPTPIKTYRNSGCPRRPINPIISVQGTVDLWPIDTLTYMLKDIKSSTLEYFLNKNSPKADKISPTPFGGSL